MNDNSVAKDDAVVQSRVVKPGDVRSKKDRPRNGPKECPPLHKSDYVRVAPISQHLGKLLRGEYHCVTLNKQDRSSHVELSQDLCTASSKKGYRMVRCTHGVAEGTWYFEVKVNHLGPSGHARLGWSTRNGEIQGPVGYDEFSFGYRDSDGSKVHQALRESFGEPYVEGDVIGCYIHLGKGGRPFEKDRSDIVSWDGSLYQLYEEVERKPEVLNGSIVGFAKNGIWQGTAYSDFKEGTYYPAVSMYTLPSQETAASVTLNFGPNFAYPLKESSIPAPAPCSDLGGKNPSKLCQSEICASKNKTSSTEVNGVSKSKNAKVA